MGTKNLTSSLRLPDFSSVFSLYPPTQVPFLLCSNPLEVAKVGLDDQVHVKY